MSASSPISLSQFLWIEHSPGQSHDLSARIMRKFGNLMPSLDDIFRYFWGVWKMMLGRKEGLDHLDVSAESFWSSFYAIAVALPPMFRSEERRVGKGRRSRETHYSHE